MQIVFNLSGVFTASSSTLENAITLRALLEALIQTDLAYLRNHAAPKLYASRVVYGRTSEWERIPDVIRRGYGDCKSLSAWLIAEYRMQGIAAKPKFRWKRRDSFGTGVPDYHILVQTSKGLECPSRRLGMNLDESSYFRTG